MISLGQRDLTGAYEASASGQMNLNATLGAVKFDGAGLAAGAAGADGTPYSIIKRGAATAIGIGYNATDLKSIIYTGALETDFSPDPSINPREPIITLSRNHLEFLDSDRTFLSSQANLFALSSEITLDFANATLGAFVLFSPTIVYRQNAEPSGMASLFDASGTFTNPNGLVRNLTVGLTFVGQNNYQADGAAITMSQALEFLSQPTWQAINAGTGTLTANYRQFIARGTFGTGWTANTPRVAFTASDLAGAGVLNAGHYGFEAAALRVAAGGSTIGFRSLQNAGATSWAFRAEGTARSDFGGAIGLGAGTTIDVELSRVAANLLRLASGDSFDIAGGDFSHTGTNFGIHGSIAPQSAAYAPTNVTTDRTYDANATSLNELADVIGTLIADLQAKGFIG